MDYLNSLKLYEQILLLALRDREGTLSPFTDIYTALGTAILAEILLDKKIEIDDEKKIKVVNNYKYDDDILQESFDLIQNAGKANSVEECFNQISSIKKLNQRVAEKLCKKNILKAEEDKILFFFTRKIYPELNAEPEKNIINLLRNLVISANNEIEPKLIVLLSIIKNTCMLESVFEKNEIKQYEEKIESIIKGEKVGAIAKEVIEAIQVATLLTIIIPSVLITTTITST